MENEGLNEQINAAFHHLVQGDTSPATKLLAEQEGIKDGNHQLSKLAIMLQIELEDNDAAERLLLSFESRFADNPDTFAFAADAWRDLGHQAGIFSKFGFYKKGVQAKLRAGEVGPDNAEYVALRAGASAHGSSYGADASLQKTLTDKAIALEQKWGYIAKLNYAQNTDDQQSGVVAAKAAVEEFHDDFVVLERVAQYYWTIDNLAQAQQTFAQACEYPPVQSWYREVKWINACYQVALFSQEHGLAVKPGEQALNRLLATYKLPTSQNVEIAVLLLDIAQQENSQLAVQRLNQAIAHANDEALVRRATKRLAMLD
ncbi:hypothetical protein ACFOEW_04330 [Alteromonas oceani]|uniref:Tetratricopeptide repeat protein n=1 Tax=Alteromonas oceani TaxID=2071609 RepID=A0ABV7JSH2_9ALTE|nr:hypothetical protein [Alteromonas oceani]